MKIELLPSTIGDPAARQFCIGTLINDIIAIDAGTLGLVWPLERQKQIQHVVLSHAHIDHIATLPLFLDNVYAIGDQCPNVFGSNETCRVLRDHIFNDQVWPDFLRLSSKETPFLTLQTMEEEIPFSLGALTLLPVALNHIVPSLGFLVSDHEGTVGFVSDTAPTERIWSLLSNVKRLKAVFLECSFPASQNMLAENSGHLCSTSFKKELEKLDRSVPVIACHLKPVFFDEITEELRSINRTNIEVGVPGQTYTF